METDPDILLQKADTAMRKYGMHVVVANELATYKSEVTVVTRCGKTKVCSQAKDHDLEMELVDILVERHSDHIKKFWARYQVTKVRLDWDNKHKGQRSWTFLFFVVIYSIKCFTNRMNCFMTSVLEDQHACFSRSLMRKYLLAARFYSSGLYNKASDPTYIVYNNFLLHTMKLFSREHNVFT